MDGTLLGGDGKTGSDAKEPPPFDANRMLRNLPDVQKPLPINLQSSSGAPSAEAQQQPLADAQSSDGPASSDIVSAVNNVDEVPARAEPTSSSDIVSAVNNADEVPARAEPTSVPAAVNNVDEVPARAAALPTARVQEEDADSRSIDSSAASDEVPAWEQAFAFIKTTDNPIAKADLSPPGDTRHGEAMAGNTPLVQVRGDDGPDPLKTDGFLKSFFG